MIAVIMLRDIPAVGMCFVWVSLVTAHGLCSLFCTTEKQPGRAAPLRVREYWVEATEQLGGRDGVSG